MPCEADHGHDEVLLLVEGETSFPMKGRRADNGKAVDTDLNVSW